MKIGPNHILFFDLDDTLIHTNLVNFTAYQTVFNWLMGDNFEIEYDPSKRFNRQQFIQHYVSLPQPILEAVIALKQTLFDPALTRLDRKMANLLAQYSTTNRTVLVTGCHQERALALLKHHGLSGRFSDMIFEKADNDARSNKYQQAIAELSIPPESIIAFENSEQAIADARKAGIQYINPKITKMKTWTIEQGIWNNLPKQAVTSFYQDDYHAGNTELREANGTIEKIICTLKNQFLDKSCENLQQVVLQLTQILSEDLPLILQQTGKTDLTVCVVPRAKKKAYYTSNQLLFKTTVSDVVEKLPGFHNGTNYIVRHTDTRTTHLNHTKYAGEGDLPYPGITSKTCTMTAEIRNKDILLIDDLYTDGIGIDEDAIQTLFDMGAKSVIFYAVGKTLKHNCSIKHR